MLFVGLAIALLADFLLLVYLLTRLPRVHPGRRAVVVAGPIGAVGLELLELPLTRYVRGVAGKSMYGASAVPVVVVLWINLMVRLLCLYCAAWTATATATEPAVQSSETAADKGPGPGTEPAVSDTPRQAAESSGP